jgi:serine/threonine-protein kinase
MLVGQQIGPFEIEKELGSGAMGTVYRAKFHKDGEKVIPIALKVIALGLLGNESAMARFEREANILKQLRHPNIVKLEATGHYRKTPFIAMEFVDGEALDRALGRRGRLSWEEVVAYGKQLCKALQYAHEKGIIHRDLKPSNLMITRDGTLKLTDFGIAKDTDVTALTGMNSTIGTAAYMSPEQCKGDKNLTPKSDLYSLGIVFYELLTGRKPFYADNTVDMFLKHVNEKPPRIDKVMPDLPPKLTALIQQLLEKDKEDRPTDAAWVERMLAEVEEDSYARKSAGLDAATTRRVDRPKGVSGPIEEADREAVRLLKGKKKKKKKALPLVEQKWFKAAVIIAALCGLAAVAYFGFIKAPSADKLYTRMEEAKTPEARLAAAEEYLKVYKDRPGEQTDKAAAVFREETVRKWEGVLNRRFGNAKYKSDPENEDPKAYSTAIAAIQAEKDGKLAEAAGLWNEIKARFPEEAKDKFPADEDRLRRARWVWLAEKRLADLAEVGTRLAQLRKEIQYIRDGDLPKYDPKSPEGLAIKGLRLKEFGDVEKAGRVWDALITLTEKEPNQRVWVLLAAQERVNLPKEDPVTAATKRKEQVSEQLAIAKRELNTAAPNNGPARQAARWICRQLIDLYDDEDQLTPFVNEAKNLLAKPG